MSRGRFKRLILLFGGIMGGVTVLMDKEFGFLKEVMIAPVRRLSIITGRSLGFITTTLIQGIVMLLASLAFGVHIQSISGFGLSIIFMILTCAVFIGLGLTLGALLEETEGFIAIMNLIQLPILFLSSAFFPFDTLKTPVLRQIMFINPFTYAVDGLRSSLIGATTLGPPIHMPDGSILPNSWAPAFPLGVDISVLLVWAIVLWGLGAYLFGKMKVD